MKTEIVIPSNFSDFEKEKFEEFMRRPEIQDQIKEFWIWSVVPNLQDKNPFLKTKTGRKLVENYGECFLAGVIFSKRVFEFINGSEEERKKKD